jgi:hypothetical protein
MVMLDEPQSAKIMVDLCKKIYSNEQASSISPLLYKTGNNLPILKSVKRHPLKNTKDSKKIKTNNKKIIKTKKGAKK